MRVKMLLVVKDGPCWRGPGIARRFDVGFVRTHLTLIMGELRHRSSTEHLMKNPVYIYAKYLNQ